MTVADPAHPGAPADVQPVPVAFTCALANSGQFVAINVDVTKADLGPVDSTVLFWYPGQTELQGCPIDLARPTDFCQRLVPRGVDVVVLPAGGPGHAVTSVSGDGCAIGRIACALHADEDEHVTVAYG